MKNKLRFITFSAIALLLIVAVFSACKKDEKVTKIVGTAYFPAGVSGDLSNVKVSIYTNIDNWNNNSPIKYVSAIGAGATVTFSMEDVLPGNYYLDVWKDIDNTATWTSGDFVGWYGAGGLGSISLTEFQITDGQTFDVDVQMYIIAKGAILPK
jgi:hypothetical protein